MPKVGLIERLVVKARMRIATSFFASTPVSAATVPQARTMPPRPLNVGRALSCIHSVPGESLRSSGISRLGKDRVDNLFKDHS